MPQKTQLGPNAKCCREDDGCHLSLAARRPFVVIRLKANRAVREKVIL